MITFDAIKWVILGYHEFVMHGLNQSHITLYLLQGSVMKQFKSSKHYMIDLFAPGGTIELGWLIISEVMWHSPDCICIDSLTAFLSL